MLIKLRLGARARGDGMSDERAQEIKTQNEKEGEGRKLETINNIVRQFPAANHINQLIRKIVKLIHRNIFD